MASLRSVMLTSVLCLAVPTSARRDVLVTAHVNEQGGANEINKELAPGNWKLASDAGDDLTASHCLMLKDASGFGGKLFKDGRIENVPGGGKVCHLHYLQNICKLKDVPNYCGTIFSNGPITSKGRSETAATFDQSGCKCEYVKPENLERAPNANSKKEFSCILASSTHSVGAVQSSNGDSSHDQVVSAGETKKEPVIDKLASDDRVTPVEDATKIVMKDNFEKALGEQISNDIKPPASDEASVVGRLVWKTRNSGSIWTSYGSKQVSGTWAVFTPRTDLKPFELKRETTIQEKTNNNAPNLLTGWCGFFKHAKTKGQGDVTVIQVGQEGQPTWMADIAFAVLQKDNSIMYPQVGITFDITSGQAVAAYLASKNVFKKQATMDYKTFTDTCNRNKDCKQAKI